MEALYTSIENIEAGMLAFDQLIPDLEEHVHNYMLREQENKQSDRHKTEELWEQHDMDRMKIFM